ncbi:Zinc finger CCHC domain-containing 8 [Gossypium australe]|uniref:Zinc finger CCHC domain-containing 8 n=1 Tax=Gossypium australe TaxID=47621 RepID=A0A5B6X4P9_9ROSI|nr:Zinc finger CCHC domain-containing 8 [Gossypium australe]
MSLVQSERSLVGYEAELLRLSKYSLALVSIDYDKKEWVFAILVNKVKITEEVKHTGRESRDREKGQSKFRRDSGPSSSVQRLKNGLGLIGLRELRHQLHQLRFRLVEIMRGATRVSVGENLGLVFDTGRWNIVLRTTLVI